MRSYRGIRPRIRWGASFGNDLVLGYPLDDAIAYSLPREGSDWAIAPSGAEDAWIVGTDYFLEGDVRWIPGEPRTDRPATGWDYHAAAGDARGVEAFLAWARQKNTLRYYPDGRNLLDSPRMDTDTDANGVVNDFASQQSGGMTVVYARDSVDGAQQVTVSAAGAAGNKAGVVQDYPAPLIGEVLSASVEVRLAALTNGMVAELALEALSSGGAVLASVVLGGLTQTSYGRVAVNGLVVPAGAASVRFAARLVAAGATSTGELRARNAQLERRATASAAVVDNPGYRSCYLAEPTKDVPTLETVSLLRRVRVKLRAVDGAPFTGY